MADQNQNQPRHEGDNQNTSDPQIRSTIVTRPPTSQPILEELMLQIQHVANSIVLQNNVIQRLVNEQAETRRIVTNGNQRADSGLRRSVSAEDHADSQTGTQTAIRQHFEQVADQNRRRGEQQQNQKDDISDRPAGQFIVGPKGYTRVGHNTLPRSQRNNPLSEDIMNHLLPRLVHPVDINKYDGSSDPGAHLGRFRTAMIPNSREDAMMCRIFPTTLADSAIDWFESLPRASIQNFDQLERMFMEYFSVSSHYHKDVTSLFQLKQEEGESLRSYMKRVGEAVSNTRDCSSEVAALACINGLARGPLKFHVSRRRPRDFRELRRIAGEFIDAEDSLNIGADTRRPLSYTDAIPGFSEQ